MMDGGNHHILIIDDDSSFSDLVQSALEAAGYQVRAVADATAASQALKSQKAHLVIVDGLLPDIDGVSWMTDLRRKDIEVRLIFVTAYGRSPNAFDWLGERLDVSAVVKKPIEPQQLCTLVDQVIGNRETAPAPVSEDTKAQFLERMETLKSKFAENLPSRLNELVTALDSANASPRDPERLDLAWNLAHKLHGTAPIYGFEAVGGVAETIEDTLFEVIDKGLEWPAAWSTLQPLLLELQNSSTSQPAVDEGF